MHLLGVIRTYRPTNGRRLGRICGFSNLLDDNSYKIQYAKSYNYALFYIILYEQCIHAYVR